jgi:hypothetical protein
MVLKYILLLLYTTVSVVVFNISVLLTEMILEYNLHTLDTMLV